jgi:hypothetical protein
MSVFYSHFARSSTRIATCCAISSLILGCFFFVFLQGVQNSGERGCLSNGGFLEGGMVRACHYPVSLVFLLLHPSPAASHHGNNFTNRCIFTACVCGDVEGACGVLQCFRVLGKVGLHATTFNAAFLGSPIRVVMVQTQTLTRLRMLRLARSALTTAVATRRTAVAGACLRVGRLLPKRASPRPISCHLRSHQNHGSVLCLFFDVWQSAASPLICPRPTLTRSGRCAHVCVCVCVCIFSPRHRSIRNV